MLGVDVAFILHTIAEDVVEREEIDKFRRVLPVQRPDLLEHFLSHILQHGIVVPEHVEYARLRYFIWGACKMGYWGKHVRIVLVAQPLHRESDVLPSKCMGCFTAAIRNQKHGSSL